MNNFFTILPMILFIIFIFWAGIYASKKMNNTNSGSFLQEYFLGGRELGGLLLAMTMVSTYASASSFISGPGVAYTQGLGWVLLSMIQVVTGYFTLMILGKKFAIVSRQMNAVTLVDFLKARYESKAVIILAACSIIVFLFASTVAQWIGGGRLVQSLTGISYQTSLFLFTIVVVVYVVIGGFRAVAITDSIMGTVMLVGTIVILVGTIIAGGGITAIMTELKEIDPNLLTPFGTSGTLTPRYVSSFWILVGIGVVGLPQISVRAMGYKDSKAMHQAIIIGTIVVGAIMFGVTITGVLGRAVLPDIEIGDTVMPTIAMEVLPPWLAGIFLAAPMAAIVSTVNSLLLVISSSIVKDIYVNYVNPNASLQVVKRWTLASTGLLGVLIFISALHPPEFLVWINLFAFGGLQAVFLWPIILGLYWEKGNAVGAITSMVIGASTYIFFDRLYPDPLGMHTVTFPILLSLLGYVIGSLCTQKKVLKN